MDDTEYGARVMLDYHIPPNYAERSRQALREDTWLNILTQVVIPNKNKYIVIRFSDDVMPGSFSEEYRVRYDISFARERHIELASYEALPLRTLSLTALGELKYRFKTRWYKFWNTERVKRG